MAIAVFDAKAKHGVARAAVVDWDVHHGNGTQWAFYRDPSVLTISIHQDRLYPIESGAIEEIGEAEGEGYNINVPLPPGSGHRAYMETVERVVVPALQKFRPDVIAVACGFDANALDPLGHMLCHSETYREMTALLTETAEAALQWQIGCLSRRRLFARLHPVLRHPGHRDHGRRSHRSAGLLSWTGFVNWAVRTFARTRAK